METAVIWIPADIDPWEPAAGVCLMYARRRGYRCEGITRAPWETIRQMLVDRDVDVVLVADQAHLPPKRSPRIEVVDDPSTRVVSTDPGDQPVPPRRRRPRAR